MGNMKNLGDTEAIDKLKVLADDIRICMFCTQLTTVPFATRPMAVQEVDEFGNIWFLSSADSNKNFEIKANENVQLIFAKPADSHYMTVYGEAIIYKDKNLIEEMWSPLAKAWFKDGKDDPNVTVIRVQPVTGFYWDTKNGKAISMLKIAFSAATGIRLETGEQGKLDVS